MLEVISRLHPTAGQQRIGGADNGGVPKSGSDVELIIVLQKGTVNDADNIAPVVVPVFIYKLRRHTLQLIGKPVFTGNVEALLQRRGVAAALYVFLRLGTQRVQKRLFHFAGARQKAADRPDIPPDIPVLLSAHASASPLMMAKTPAVTVSYSAISSRSFSSPAGSMW